MTLRAVILGFCLGMAIASVTCFNNWVIRQNWLTANLLPIGVFGTIVVMALLLSPLLAILRKSWALQGREIAVIAALALASCGWADAAFFRYYLGAMTGPAHMARNKLAWDSANVMSYLPQGSGLVGEGHLRQVPEFCRLLLRKTQANDALTLRLWSRFNQDQRALVEQTAGNNRISPQQTRALVKAINDAIKAEDLLTGLPLEDVPLAPEERALVQPALEGKLATYDLRHRLYQLHRAVLVAAYPEHVLPRPGGVEVILLNGRRDVETIEAIGQGASGTHWPDWMRVPWGNWWPTLRLWGGMAFLLGLAGLGLALVVHPQWTQRELLPYPVVRFVTDLSAREDGRLFPAVVYTRMFWCGLGVMMVLHAVNGLKAWNPAFFLYIPLSPLDGTPLKTFFPNIAGHELADGMFRPRLYPSIIAFACFLTTEVSLSMALSLPLWLMFSAALVGYGVTLPGRWSDHNPPNLLVSGFSLGIALMVLYAGRRHYGRVALASVGLGRSQETPRSSVWGARLAGGSVLGVLYLFHMAGVDWVVALPLVVLLLVDYVAVTRVNAETGMILIQPLGYSLCVLTVLFGMEAIGPTTYLVISIASMILRTDMRETVMAQLNNALCLGDRTGQVTPGRLAPLLAGMAAAALVLAVAAGLMTQYNYPPMNDGFSRDTVGAFPFDQTTTYLGALSASGQLEQSMQWRGLERLAHLQPAWGSLGWVAAGVALVVLVGMARLRFSWWPLHPALLLICGGWPSRMYAWSFFLGWLLKISVTRCAGTKGFHAFRPLLVGIIAGELMMALFWILFGALYYFSTGKLPVAYSVF